MAMLLLHSHGPLRMQSLCQRARLPEFRLQRTNFCQQCGELFGMEKEDRAASENGFDDFARANRQWASELVDQLGLRCVTQEMKHGG